nr:GDSL-type esterase/lipase family protein [Priestia taiwanensis]
MRVVAMKQILLRGVIVVAVLCTGLFGYGLVTGARSVLYPTGAAIEKLQIEKKERATDEPLQVVSLGDSLTRGVGDDKGLGYIGRFRDEMATVWKQELEVANLAVSGEKAPDLLAQLKKEGVQYTVKQADMLVLTIGGNDLFPGASKLQQLDLKTYKADIDSFTKNTKEILTTLRTLNEQAPIYWLGLYDPFEEVEGLDGSSQFVVEWNKALEHIATTYEDVYVIPTFDLFHGKGKDFLYTDHFHPNKEGYRLMAERLTQKVTSQLNLQKGGED